MDFCAAWPPRERHDPCAPSPDARGLADQADKLPGSLWGGPARGSRGTRARHAPALFAADSRPETSIPARLGAMRPVSRLVADGQTLVIVTHEPDVHVMRPAP